MLIGGLGFCLPPPPNFIEFSISQECLATLRGRVLSIKVSCRRCVAALYVPFLSTPFWRGLFPLCERRAFFRLTRLCTSYEYDGARAALQGVSVKHRYAATALTSEEGDHLSADCRLFVRARRARRRSGVRLYETTHFSLGGAGGGFQLFTRSRSRPVTRGARDPVSHTGSGLPRSPLF